jgi:hypothetical protein
MTAWDEHLADPYLPRKLPRLLREAGFTLEQCVAIPLLNYGYDPDAFSAGLIGMIAAFVPGRRGVTEADAQAWAADLQNLGEDYFFSLNRYVFLAIS